MIMSSFLMNPASYTEPKFPPSEDYSQSNYMGPQNTDYYRQNIHNFGYGPADYRRYDIEEKYSPSSVYTQPPVTCDTELINKRLSQPQPQQPQSHQQQQPQHHQQQQQQHQQSPPQAHVQSPNSTNSLASTNVINTNNVSNNNNSAVNTNNRVNGYTSPVHDQESSDESGSPQSVPSPGSQGSPESNCGKEQGGQPVIYPWMRKSQSGNNNNNSGNVAIYLSI